MKRLCNILFFLLFLLPFCTKSADRSDIDRIILSQQCIWDSGTDHYNADVSHFEYSEYQGPHKVRKYRTRIWTKMFPFLIERIDIPVVIRIEVIEQKVPYPALFLFSSDVSTLSLRGPPQYV